MIMGKKRINNDVVYTRFKKHYCPHCGVRLKCVNVSRIVNSHSKEAKNFDFTFVDSFLVGDIEFTWKEFQCPKCLQQFSVQSVKKMEREAKG